MAADVRVNVHAVVARSRANGPGERTVVWFQGCPLACPGCFNPRTHADDPAHLTSVDRLVERIRRAAPGLEGVTISGGEPFAQPEALLALSARVRRETPLSILVFSGYTMREIRRRRHGESILATIDVLIAGRYVRRMHGGRDLLGSANQRIHLLTDRYRLEDVTATPEGEILIDAEGGLIGTGIGAPLAPAAG